MIQLAETENCSGCMACAAACPQSAIELVMDDLGDPIPRISSDRCIGCGKCQRACPELKPLIGVEPNQAFAVWSLDPENRRTSASGGAAAEFYSCALKEGFWICGAEYTTDGRVIHTLRRSPDAIRGYKQSKYVYSETGDIYQQIKEKLDAGEGVLMISLPCKIAGLLGSLRKPYEKLITVDIVCHGTPAPRLLQEHISENCPELKDFQLQFREDNEFMFQLTADGKRVYRKIGRTDAYLAAFLEGLSYREACYHCTFAKPQRISDLTICDFWGIGAEIPFDHPYTGAISAVLVNTQKGRSFFEQARNALFTEERPVSEAVNGNAQLRAPTPRHPKRDHFEALYREKGFDRAVEILLQDEMHAARRNVQRRQIRSGLRRIAGVFLKRYRG